MPGPFPPTAAQPVAPHTVLMTSSSYDPRGPMPFPPPGARPVTPPGPSGAGVSANVIVPAVLAIALMGTLLAWVMVRAPSRPVRSVDADTTEAMEPVPSLPPPPTPPAPPTEPAVHRELVDSLVYRVPVGTSPVRGPRDALVTIVEFSDFQCPFCGRVTETLDTLVSRYRNDLRIVWKNYPLPFHQNAMPGAEAAMAAAAQGRFWEMHNLLFRNQQALGHADLLRYASELGLNSDSVARALDSHAFQSQVRADMALATSLGVTGTPSFFVNGHPLVGAQPLDSFVTAVERALRDARATLATGVPRSSVYDTLMANATAPQP